MSTRLSGHYFKKSGGEYVSSPATNFLSRRPVRGLPFSLQEKMPVFRRREKAQAVKKPTSGKTEEAARRLPGPAEGGRPANGGGFAYAEWGCKCRLCRPGRRAGHSIFGGARRKAQTG